MPHKQQPRARSVTVPAEAPSLALGSALFGAEGPITLRASEAFFYTGSLTAPPCLEGVQWIVLKRTLYFSLDQLAAIARAVTVTGTGGGGGGGGGQGLNARPTQNQFWVNGLVDVRTSSL